MRCCAKDRYGKGERGEGLGVGKWEMGTGNGGCTWKGNHSTARLLTGHGSSNIDASGSDGRRIPGPMSWRLFVCSTREPHPRAAAGSETDLRPRPRLMRDSVKVNLNSTTQRSALAVTFRDLSPEPLMIWSFGARRRGITGLGTRDMFQSTPVRTVRNNPDQDSLFGAFRQVGPGLSSHHSREIERRERPATVVSSFVMHLVCVAQLLLVPRPPSTLPVIGAYAHSTPRPNNMRDDVSGLASACPGAPFVNGASLDQPRRVASKEPPKWLAYRLLASTLAVRACRVGVGQCGCRRLRVDG